MEKEDHAFEVLCEAMMQMTPAQYMVLQKKYAGKPEEDYRIFLKAYEEVCNRKKSLIKTESLSDKPEERKLSVSEKYQEKSFFKQKLYQYIDSYREKQKGGKITLTEIYTDAGFDYNSWYRMLESFGRGKQYHDKLRCLCFVLRMNFPVANEMLLFAGQPFDLGSTRDYHIIYCLEKGIYSPGEINEYLESQKQQPLFSWE